MSDTVLLYMRDGITLEVTSRFSEAQLALKKQPWATFQGPGGDKVLVNSAQVMFVTVVSVEEL